MKNLFKHILFGAAIFAGMGLFVGCDTMTDDEIEKLINDKLNESSSNATADATPPVELAGTTWVSYGHWIKDVDEEPGHIEVDGERFLHFTETTIIDSGKTYKRDDSLFEWEETIGEYYVQGNIIIANILEGHLTYFPKEDCIIFEGRKYYRVEE